MRLLLLLLLPLLPIMVLLASQNPARAQPQTPFVQITRRALNDRVSTVITMLANAQKSSMLVSEAEAEAEALAETHLPHAAFLFHVGR